MYQKTNKRNKVNKADFHPQVVIGVCLVILLCLILSVWLLLAQINSTGSTGDLRSDTTVRTAPQSQKNQGQERKADGKTISYAQLPRQAQDVYVLILKGGPFKYRQDGSTFTNREKLLPQQSRGYGYYKEYTVNTPLVSHRGARRIVCGGKIKTKPQECYYTADHYKSFRQIVNAPLAK